MTLKICPTTLISNIFTGTTAPRNSGNRRLLIGLFAIKTIFFFFCYIFIMTGKMKIPTSVSSGTSDPLNGSTKNVLSTHNYNIESFCSDRATKRGPMQRVVSFCFYGPPNSKRNYLLGIKGNAELIPLFYPNWTMRVYHEIQENDTQWTSLMHLEEEFPHLDLCNVSSLSVLGNVEGHLQSSWRFMAMEDPLVEVFVSRDLDSRPSLREKAAVAEWLASNYTFHIMRDHYKHLAFILAGMWGARRDIDPVFYQKTSNKLYKKTWGHGKKKMDQVILRLILQPVLSGHVMQHDSYFCNLSWKNIGGMTAYSQQRTNNSYNFIGARISIDVTPLQRPCPQNCRPANHKDWKTC